MLPLCSEEIRSERFLSFNRFLKVPFARDVEQRLYKKGKRTPWAFFPSRIELQYCMGKQIISGRLARRPGPLLGALQGAQ